MFITGMNPFLGSVFMFLTLIIAVPSGVKVFNWLATLWRGNIRFTAAMLFAIGFVSLFISGGLTGIILGNATLDIQMHNTYFVVAHFHLVMGSAFFWLVCRHLPLVPENVWAHDGREAGLYSLLAHLRWVCTWCLCRCTTSALLASPPLLRLDGLRRLLAVCRPEQVHLDCCYPGVLRAVYLHFQLLLQHSSAAVGPPRTLELYHAGMDDSIDPGHGNWPGEIPAVYRWPYDYSKPGAEKTSFRRTCRTLANPVVEPALRAEQRAE
ncbi:MAG: cbb3-type cytochrome c oxidase subunit I [Hymenobacter sp.]